MHITSILFSHIFTIAQIPKQVPAAWGFACDRKIIMKKRICFDHPRIRGVGELNKAPPWLIGAQIGNIQFAPQNFSTAFPKNRYQKIATFWERCRSFCKKTPVFHKNREEKRFFSVLHKGFTAFAYRIRAPPSEV